MPVVVTVQSSPATTAAAFFSSPGSPTMSLKDSRGNPLTSHEVSGTVSVEYTGEADPTRMRCVIVDADGGFFVVGTGLGPYTWDTTSLPNGAYTIQFEAMPEDGFGPQQSGMRLVENELVFVRNPVSTAAEALGAAAAGTAVAGLGAMIASRASVLGELARESAIAIGEDKLKEATERGRRRIADENFGQRLWHGFIRGVAWLEEHLLRVTHRWAILATVLALTVFFTIEGLEGDGWSAVWASLPVVGLAAVIFGLGAIGLEMILARASGSTSAVRLYGPGIFSLAFSAIVFRSAFGYPSYVDEMRDGEEDHLAARTEAIRAMALAASVLLALTIFVTLGFWSFDLMEEGLVVAVAGLAGATMPVAPLPGKDIWDWNKGASLAVFLAAIGMFLTIHLALLPLRWIFAIGLVGFAIYLAVVIWLLREDPENVPEPATE